MRDHAIQVRLQNEALEMDPRRGRLRLLDHGSGSELEVPFDQLVLATGSRPRRLGIPGEDAGNVFTLKDMGDGIRIKHFLEKRRPQQAVIIGAGYISLEVAEALRRRGVKTTLLYRGEVPYSGLEPEVGRLIVKALEENGVEYVPRVTPQALEGNGGEALRVLTDAGAFEADLFFVGAGVEPNVELARQAGIRIGETGGIAVDQGMRTSHPSILAAGDCCEKYHRVIERPVLAPFGDVANKEGRVAGENAVGGDARFNGIVGASCVKVFELEIGTVGVSEAVAQRLGFKTISQVVETTSRVGIYPGARPSLLKLVADASTGRVLGGSLVGTDGEARKVNALAVALYNRMSLDDVAQLDLAYAPPFSSVLDPLLVAATLLQRKVQRRDRG